MISKISKLTNALEIVRFLGIDDGMACHFQNISGLIESEFLSCIGTPILDRLCQALIPYTDQKKWNNTETFPVGCPVEHCGELYIVCKEAKCIEPPNIDYYKPAAKFKDTATCNGCNWNEFWCYYLGPHIAHCIGLNRLPRIATQLTDAGLIQPKSENAHAASDRKYNSYKASWQDEMSRYRQLMKNYAKKHPGCFSGSGLLGGSLCGSCGCVQQDCSCPDECENELMGLSDYDYYDPSE